MIPHELSKSDIVKIIKQLDKLSPSFSLDFTLQKACLAERRSEYSYKRAPSYTDVASMKLKQDVESSWQCPFVSASKGESEAQQAFCNVKSLSLLFAWVVLWMRRRKKASASCVSVRDSPL